MAMGIAQSPAKTLAMQGFMMYMTGSSVSIISIMVVGMSLLNSFKSLLATNQRECVQTCFLNRRVDNDGVSSARLMTFLTIKMQQ